MHTTDTPPVNTTDFLTRLRRHRLVAVVRGRDPEAALRTVHTLAEEGVALIEVSLTTPDACEVLSRAADRLAPHLVLGAGTVVTAEDARRAREAGAGWVVTPGLGTGVTEAVASGMPVLAGALTPTEAIAAQQAGATAVKLFPASLGGPDYLRALRGPLPHLPFVPVGGVDEAAARAYLAAGAVAVGVGGPLIGDAADGGDQAALRERARAYRRVCDTGAAADRGAPGDGADAA